MPISDCSSDVCSSDLRARFQKDATTYFLSPLLPASVLDGVEYDQFGRARITSYAAFGQASWHVTDRATLTGGLRYTIETKEASNTGSRSEEHTSELPVTNAHLVCRLLLEKKKNTNKYS